jgi:rubrerythrin
MPMLKYLKTALEMEIKGRDFYDNVLKSIKDPTVKEIFTILRDDEIVHFKRIQEIYNSIQKNEPWDKKWEKLGEAHSDLDIFFKNIINQRKESADFKDELDALNLGIQFEKNAVKFYKSHLENASSEEEKIFLKKLIEEEESHFKALSDMKLFYENPDAFFMEMEHSGLDGA